MLMELNKRYQNVNGAAPVTVGLMTAFLACNPSTSGHFAPSSLMPRGVRYQLQLEKTPIQVW